VGATTGLQSLSGAATASVGVTSTDTAGHLLTQQQAIAAGIFTHAQTKNSDGSITDTYTFADGVVAKSITPPPGFNPLLASDEQLVEYGLPPRPTGSAAALAQWTQAMAAWKGAPTPKLAVKLSHPASQTNDTNGNGNWTGYVNTSSQQTYSGAESTFAAPNVGPSCGFNPVSGETGGPGGMSIWTGLGGLFSQQLIQSGITAGESLVGGPGPTVWQPFWEMIATINGGNYNLGPDLLKSVNQSAAVAINPGNTVWSKTTYDTSSGTATYFVENETSGQSSSFSVSNTFYGPTSDFYDGSSADFVTEDPANGYDLVPFSEFSMTANEQLVSGAWSPLTYWPFEQWTSLPYVTSAGGLLPGGSNVNFAVSMQDPSCAYLGSD
jgi:hypothetical protein